MGLTDDPRDPRLRRGVDEKRIGGQHDTYLVLSEEERAQGFVRPYRDRYKHLGIPGPRFALRLLTVEEAGRHAGAGYAQYEAYPESEGPATGRFWTWAQLDAAGPCGAVTTMGRALSETYARDPHFYGATFCVACDMHRPVGEAGEFVWIEVDGTDGPKVGT